MLGTQGLSAIYRQGYEIDPSHRVKTRLVATKLLGLSSMEAAIRQKLVSEIKKQFESGTIITGIVTVKTYIVRFKKNIALTRNNQKREFMLKTINKYEVENYLKQNENQIENIIDKWVYVSPQTIHIVRAFEVLEDYGRTNILMEFCSNSQNVFQYLKQLNQNFMSGIITQTVAKCLFLYIIQVSHAFSIAHSNDLTHGAFDLSQVLILESDKLTESGGNVIFKITSFRPWLVKKKTDLKRNSVNQLNDEDHLNIGKCKDLFDFGVSIFEFMIGKKEEFSKNIVEKYSESKEGSVHSTQQENLMVSSQVMPYLDSLPLGWLKMTECSCLIQILHQTMVVNSGQNTAETFEIIKNLATSEFQKHFDEDFRAPESVPNRNSFKEKAIALNNRAAILPIKKFTLSFNKMNSTYANQQIAVRRSKMFELAREIDQDNCYVIVNQIMDQWRQGLILDQDFCQNVFHKLNKSNQNLKLALCIAFSLITGYPIVKSRSSDKMLNNVLKYQNIEEDSIFQQLRDGIYNIISQIKKGSQIGYDSSVPLNEIIERQIEFDNQSVSKMSKNRSVGFISNENSMLRDSQEDNRFIDNDKENQQNNYTEESDDQHEQKLLEKFSKLCEVNKIVFSSNERYALLITQYQVSLVKIKLAQIQLIVRFDLPKVYSDSPVQKFTWIGAVNNTGTRVALTCIEEFAIKVRQQTIGRHFDNYKEEEMELSDRYMITNQIWFWNTTNLSNPPKPVQIGKFCPDEILEISFESDDPNQKHYRLFNPSKSLAEQISPTSESSKRNFSLKGQDQMNMSQNGEDDIQQQSLDANFFEVKCKNLKSYGFILPDQSFNPKLIYQKQLAGGYSQHQGLFRVQPSDQSEHLNKIYPTYDFNQTSDPKEGEPNWTLLKLSLYPHAKQFILKQESVRNIVQFSKYEPKYIYVYQTSIYKQRQPHIFIWNVLSRTVVRRMYPESEPFQFENYQTHISTPTTTNSNHFKSKHEKIECFGISPFGTYMLAVQGSKLYKKYLPGAVVQQFKRLFKGCYYQEIVSKVQDNTTKSQSQFLQKEEDSEIEDSNVDLESVEKNDQMSISAEISKKITKRGITLRNKVKMDNFLELYQKYMSYQGSANQKHTYLIQLYASIVEVMQDPGRFIYEATKVSKQNKNLRKCMDILREFHFYYSIESPDSDLGTQFYNQYSHKASIKNLHKVQTFDKISFARPSDQIRYFCLCSTLKNWFLAVFHARVLQIYDHLTGAQEYEINMPSCRGIHFLDSEQLIILEDGVSNVFICSIEMQKRTFQERLIKSKKKLDEVKTVQYNDEIDDLLVAINKDMDYSKRLGKQEENDEVDYEDMKDTAGVKVIRFDEDIRRVFCSRNTTGFGYIAIVGLSKMSLYYAYADEIVAMYDHKWTLNQWDLRMNNSGVRVELLDITDSCQSFVTYSSSGEVSLWSIKTKTFTCKISQLKQSYLPWTQMRVIREDKIVIGYSRLQKKFFILKRSASPNIEAEASVLQLEDFSSENEEFGECSNFQIDKTQQYLVAVFPQSNQLIVIGIDSQQLLLRVCRPEILLQHVWLDETGCFMASLNAKQNAVDIYIFEWSYDIKEPIKQQKQDSGFDEMQKQALAEEAQKLAELQRENLKKQTKVCAIL